MDEASRKQRNQQRLTECFPTFATNVALVISDLEQQGFRPRIQDAHRSIADQLTAFKNGFSKVKFGFHNVTGAGGQPEALAVDMLDDDNPLNPPREYLIRLAARAQANNLQSGAFFGLTQVLKSGLQQAIQNLTFGPQVKIGFDPTHIEVTGITIAQARAGTRPA
jgi:hypothetical protein